MSSFLLTAPPAHASTPGPDGTPAPPGATRPRRNLVLCFEGTAGTFGPSLTNIPTLLSFLGNDPAEQLCYYQTGIGTYSPMSTPRGWIRALARLADEAVAWDLDQHVQGGYTFLMQSYAPGDRIWLFGFSRGAYTARALAGMLQQVGLLPAGNTESVPLAYHIFASKATSELYPGETLAAGFRRTFSRVVPVHFVGVWDTVAAVGLIIPRTLPFAQGSHAIAHFRHALALDERRVRFTPQPWKGDPPLTGVPIPSTPVPPSPAAAASTSTSAEALLAPGTSTPAPPPPTTSIKELWFIGGHGNIGGGDSPTDGDVSPRLSHLPLRWMVREALAQGLVLDLDAVLSSGVYRPLVQEVRARLDAVQGDRKEQGDEGVKAWREQARALGVDPLLVGVVDLATRQPAVEQQALAPRGDALAWGIALPPRLSLKARLGGLLRRTGQRARTALWWLLELLLTVTVVWEVDGSEKAVSQRRIGPNLGRGRLLPASPVFHTSVRDRLAAAPGAFLPGDGYGVPETHYQIRARFAKGQSMKDVGFEE